MESLIREYMIQGGKLFTIKLISTIRDGGTRQIDTTKDTYYLNMNQKDFHTNYPPEDNNKIQNPFLINYLISLMEEYVRREEDTLRCDQLILGQVQRNNYGLEINN